MALSDVITHVRRIVQDEPWEDFLTAGYTAAQTSVTVNSPTSWEEGDIMDFSSDPSGASPPVYEQMRVKADATVNPVSIKFAHNDTTNLNHANGIAMLKNPRYGSDQISRMVIHVINSQLWPDVFVVLNTTLTPSVVTAIYDLPADYEDFVTIAQMAAGNIEDIRYLNRVDELLNVPTAISASNKALRIWGAWPRLDVNGTLFYRAKVTFTTMTADMEPMIAYGTSIALLRAEMQEKNDRSDEDDRVGRAYRSLRDLQRAFDDEKQRMRAELMNQWGTKRRFRHALSGVPSAYRG
jgi:hypothetical protein